MRRSRRIPPYGVSRGGGYPKRRRLREARSCPLRLTPQGDRRPSRLLDHLQPTLRRRHYALRTEASYLHWIRRYILFHHKRHPANMATPEIEAFLTPLAVDQHVSAAT